MASGKSASEEKRVVYNTIMKNIKQPPMRDRVNENSFSPKNWWFHVHFTPWGSWKSGSEKPVSNCCLGTVGQREMEGSGKSMPRFFVIREISCIRYYTNHTIAYIEPRNLNDTSGVVFYLSKLCLRVVKILKESGILPCKEEHLYLTTW